ncbi:FliO/MopB family protein [Nitrospira sp. BLG_2]|uniref:FliO/MopB family protein n=1 Tax=Nitrospira sp. BLG_2 TaxID=3397507 RepID=UPI003B9D859D
MIDLWESLFRTVSALAIVLVLMGIVAVTVRRLMGQRMGIAGGRPLVRVLASSYIAPRKTIALVSVAGEYLIVGTTATDLVPLGRITDSSELRELLTVADEKPSTESASVPRDTFVSRLRRLPLGVFHHGRGFHDR